MAVGVSQRVGIVGGGIIGLAVARELLRRRPGSRVTVLEKEHDVARHQTSHNSGVAHAGLYYKPGSLKATLCRRGVGLLKDFCAHHRLAFEECGKLVVALDDNETARLRGIVERAAANGVPDVRLVPREAIRDIEPHADGRLALHSPHTAIVDFGGVARTIVQEIGEQGAEVHLGVPVMSIHQGTDVVVTSPTAQYRFDVLVICAGLHSDRVARLAGHVDEPRIIPFRGEYYRLIPERSHLVRGLIYPVPDPRLPFLGVHFTRRIGGAVDMGPNAVLALAREGYRRVDFNARDVGEMLGWPGFWRIAGRYWRVALAEIAGSVSKAWFVSLARKYVPDVTTRDVVPAPAGVRAQAVDRRGTLVDDFSLTRSGAIFAVRNAPSPAATSSLAIAEHICSELLAAR